jgi:hypothetical protein
MIRAKLFLFLGGMMLVVGLPLLGFWARRDGTPRCAFDGLPIEPVYRVSVFRGRDVSNEFCCVRCAERWLERNSTSDVLVTDETSGERIDARDAWFVRSTVVTNRVTGNRVHVFRERAAGALDPSFDGDFLPDTREITADGFLNLFKFLISTIEKIHNEGIIHRDIKPENILIENNNYLLADFGIASFNPEIFKIIAETDKKERVGNRLFSAPEQEEKGVEAHPTMDIYAIGQVLQWYATGSTHRGTGRQKIIQSKKRSDSENFSYFFNYSVNLSF